MFGRLARNILLLKVCGEMLPDVLLRFPAKRIRAICIKEYIAGIYDKVVCCSCGNAATALKNAGLDVLYIGPNGLLIPTRWFSQLEIHRMFPECFDATSGHLPLELMRIIGEAFKKSLGDLAETIYVPTGSGETLLCLKMAYPQNKFIAVYNLDDATLYNENAPLNPLVEIVADKIIFADRKECL